MSWVKDTDGDFINLDHVQRIGVSEVNHVEGSDSKATHGVFVSFPAGDEADHIIFLGTEIECEAHKVSIGRKLHFLPGA